MRGRLGSTKMNGSARYTLRHSTAVQCSSVSILRRISAVPHSPPFATARKVASSA